MLIKEVYLMLFFESFNFIFLLLFFQIFCNKMSLRNNIILGIGDWGLGIGDCGLGPRPNPQSPIPKISNLNINFS
jgi:hypothetical protein